MNRLQFISSLVQALAWPAAVVVLALIVRRPLGLVLGGPVRRCKAGPSGVEVEYWDRHAEEVRSKLQQAVEAQVQDEAPAATAAAMNLPDELKPLADIAPAAVILESYARIEQQLRELLRSAQALPDRPVGAWRLARLAEERGLIRPDTKEAIEGLTVLRNLVAHGQAPSDLDRPRALQYAALADAVLFALKRGGHDGPHEKPTTG
jgi:hypothetical protein